MLLNSCYFISKFVGMMKKSYSSVLPLNDGTAECFQLWGFRPQLHVTNKRDRMSYCVFPASRTNQSWLLYDQVQ